MLNRAPEPRKKPLAIDIAAHHRHPKAEVMTLKDAVEHWIFRLGQARQGPDPVAQARTRFGPYDGVGLAERPAHQDEDARSLRW